MELKNSKLRITIAAEGLVLVIAELLFALVLLLLVR